MFLFYLFILKILMMIIFAYNYNSYLVYNRKKSFTPEARYIDIFTEIVVLKFFQLSLKA